MCAGISLPFSALPLELIERHRLRGRVHERGGERELQFLYRQRPCCLPVWHEGRLRVVRWGARRGESRVLPCTGWTWRATVEAGGWAAWRAVPVDVPATMALERGIWYKVRQGIRGLLVDDEHGIPTAYLICEPSSHYYEVMTQPLDAGADRRADLRGVRNRPESNLPPSPYKAIRARPSQA